MSAVSIQRLYDVDLREYLKYATQLESSVYCLQNALDISKNTFNQIKHAQYEAESQIKNAKEAIPHEKDYHRYIDEPDKFRIKWDSIGTPVVVLIISSIIFLICRAIYKGNDDINVNPILIASGIVAIIECFVIIVRIINSFIDYVYARDKYERASQKAHNRYRKDKRKAKDNLVAVKEKAEQEIENYEDQARAVASEVKELKKTLDETQAALDALYSVNIIYPKYRNFAAICTIYEYFDSGRCTELSGPTGAYNLYRNCV